jgi:hypothetical protein
LQCRNCGDVVDPRRVELGYDYCLKEECVEICLKRVQLAAVGVNKAADYYMKAEEVLPPRPPAAEAGQVAEPEAGDLDERHEPAERGQPVQLGESREPAQAGQVRPSVPRQAANAPKRLKTTLERLREFETALDAALDLSYERFRRGEITATELHRDRDRLVEAFNRVVMRENIRYRSMLRGPANRAG